MGLFRIELSNNKAYSLITSCEVKASGVMKTFVLKELNVYLAIGEKLPVKILTTEN